MVQEIASSAHSQATSLQQVNTAVAEVDRVTQQNAAMVEESTAAARSLSQEASGLANVVQRFVTGSGVANRQIRASASRPRFVPSAKIQYQSSGNAALKVLADEDWAEF